MMVARSHDTVQLLDAFAWACPHCGQFTYEDAITILPDMPDDEKHECAVAAGLIDETERMQVWPEGNLLCAPCRVVCRSCASGFDTLFPEPANRIRPESKEHP